ncbi:hypothetical protein F2Q69_00012611 [Brassica cretica]|uniref:Uncharacterized protein n=1 Tax=Brassica cretica TaxID=69181 RepID=A0A8S9R915_BRACR|nr:hypothetical protein F2Q69_00012611 [Brassica cretica]
MIPTESTASCNAKRILTHEEFIAKHPHPPNPDNIPKIDVARLNELRPKPKPLDNPPETVRIPSDDGEDSMEVDRVPMRRTLRKRKEKVEMHLKRGPMIRKRKVSEKRPSGSAGGAFKRIVHFCGLFLEEFKRYCERPIGAVGNLQSKQLCLTVIDPHTHYDPIPVKKSQTSSRRINDPGTIAACHCGVEYETEYHTATSIDSGHQKSTNKRQEELVHSSPYDWENDYYNPHYCRIHQTKHAYIRADDHHHKSYAVEITTYEPGEDELHVGFTYEEPLNMQRRDETNQHRSEAAWGRTRSSHLTDRANRPSIDINPSTSIDVAHTTSIDIRSKQKTTVSEKDKFDNEYLTPDKFGIFRDPDGYARAIDKHILNISRKDIADILQTANGAENLFVHQCNIPDYQRKDTKEFYDTAGGTDQSFKRRSRHPTRPSIDVDVPTSVDRRPEFGRRAFDIYGTRKFYWEEKNEYGVYIDDQGYARDPEGHTIRVNNRDIRRLLERASRDEPSYICLLEQASSFTQTKLVPEIYTKDEINEMFYGVCGVREKYEGDFQMKLDGVYHPLNDSIGWLTTSMEEMRQDIARIQHATDVSRHKLIDRRQHASIDSRLPTSIDQRLPALVDNSPLDSPPMKSPQDFHTREEIDQLVEEIYRALDTIGDRLDGKCDDIYFPMDLSISALTSKIEAMQGGLVEIQSYIARRSEASASINKRNNISTDILLQTSVDEATNRGWLVPKVTSDMSDTHHHGEEISADIYATLRRHQFNLESLEDRLQRMENTTATMKEK